MFEQIVEQINGVLGLTVGGVSVVAIITSVIVMLKEVSKVKKDGELNKKCIEEAFTNAVLPRTVKLDLSSKIETPLKEGFEAIKAELETKIYELEERERLILSILAQFNHVKKLPEEMQKQIEEYSTENTSTTVTL